MPRAGAPDLRAALVNEPTYRSRQQESVEGPASNA
jgi:hypothetical protein